MRSLDSIFLMLAEYGLVCSKHFTRGEGQGDRRKNKYVKYVFGILGTLTDRKKI
jgi:hypothetical protein